MKKEDGKSQSGKGGNGRSQRRGGEQEELQWGDRDSVRDVRECGSKDEDE